MKGIKTIGAAVLIGAALATAGAAHADRSGPESETALLHGICRYLDNHPGLYAFNDLSSGAANAYWPHSAAGIVVTNATQLVCPWHNADAITWSNAYHVYQYGASPQPPTFPAFQPEWVHMHWEPITS